MRGSPQEFFDRIDSRLGLNDDDCLAIDKAVAELPEPCRTAAWNDRGGNRCVVVEAVACSERSSTFVFLRSTSGVVVVVRRSDGWTTGGCVASIAEAIEVMRLTVAQPGEVSLPADCRQHAH
ncbi:MAG: hypothetical protein J2P50_12800 [Hyphomicrobiaceae bacterium]|nr:hypothetical protein [Hyphomicrobiaceae bacterium]